MRSLICAAAASLALMSGSAWAGATTTDFEVQLTVANSCSVTTLPTDVNFGDHEDLTSASTSVPIGSTSFQLTCTDGAAVKVEMDDGQNYDLINSIRRMKRSSSTEYVSYNICQDTSCTDPWGADPDHVSITGTGNAELLTAYLKVPDQTSTPSTDTYSDSVTINISF